MSGKLGADIVRMQRTPGRALLPAEQRRQPVVATRECADRAHHRRVGHSDRTPLALFGNVVEYHSVSLEADVLLLQRRGPVMVVESSVLLAPATQQAKGDEPTGAASDPGPVG